MLVLTRRLGESITIGDDIKIVIFEKNLIYYGVLCDTFENLTVLDEIISKIHQKIMSYLIKKNINIEAEIIYDRELNEVIEEVISDALSHELGSQKEIEIIKYLKELTSTEDIEGLILLTDRGKVIYSSYNKLDLRRFLKELDFRVKIYNNSTFNTSGHNCEIFHYSFASKTSGPPEN